MTAHRTPSAPDRPPAPPRVVIEGVSPEIDGGLFAAKRTVGELLEVQADVFCDGHDAIAVDLLWRPGADAEWVRQPMSPLGNDRWSAGVRPSTMGPHRYSIEAWTDDFETWRHSTTKKRAAGLDVDLEQRMGVALLTAAAGAASGPDAEVLTAALGSASIDEMLDRTEVAGAMRRWGARPNCTRLPRELVVDVDRPRARFSSWYELFPRSTADEPGRHGTLDDCRRRLPYIAEMGFDVVYLPPIHPIGHSHRKGPNNTLQTAPGDPGSPWAIGSGAGGHDAIHPDLGTTTDLRALVADADALGMEVALDLAFQCSPDHPWVRSHPEWFRHRPDGSIQYAENPPKRYEDIYPFDFETDDWQGLWSALHTVVEHWVEHGIRIFRVDNPHTKPFPFWQWLIAEVRRTHPDVLFLAEAFTRPRVMERLAKLGFSQSYTYFTWRQSKYELTEYLTELTRTDLVEYFRPNFWPNTPDILTEQLQTGSRSVFVSRLVLAATLTANYGIYGPVYELMESVARPGAEEYIDSEKYQVRIFDLDRPDSLRHLITRVNQIRRRHPALQHDRTLRFHTTDNEALLCWSKSETDPAHGDVGDVVLVIANLDPHFTQSGWVSLDLEALGVEEGASFQVHDEISGARFLWHGSRNFVQLDPASMPAHVMAVRRRVRDEHDFDYFQ